MKNMFVAAGSLAFLLSSLFAVSAQGVPRGAAQGAAEGNAAAGPVGAVVESSVASPEESKDYSGLINAHASMNM
jgi:hypothetical protein